MTRAHPPAGGDARSAPPPQPPVVAPGPRRPRLELVAVEGNPTDAQRVAIQRALEEVVDQERRQREGSLWMRGGRAQGRRLGMSDYRDRFSREDAWRLSARFPYGGREYPGLVGRGDAR